MSRPAFRFAPSPNGLLHLGHALSAGLNSRMAGVSGGRLLLRIENIDPARSTLAFEEAIRRDLRWLGLGWEEPVRRQSEHLDGYRAALDRLRREELIYPAFMSRGAIRARIAAAKQRGERWPLNPDGAPLYPGLDRRLSARERAERITAGEPFAWRLDMAEALARIGRPLAWREFADASARNTADLPARPEAWGDVALASRDLPASYHLAVVADDAVQNITHVVRGRDLFEATAVHRVLQELLGLSAPLYHHHRLVLDEKGRKLSKSRDARAVAALREAGLAPQEVWRMVGIEEIRG